MRRLLVGLALVALGLPAAGEHPPHPRQLLRDDAALFQPPAYEPTDVVKTSDPRIRAVFYTGPHYKNVPTKVFAFLGVPETKAGGRVPAMVLIHGGGGTAFESWVKLWVDRGYAAIAMDTCGCLPVRDEKNAKGWRRNEAGGPPGWDESFNQLDAAVTDQWQYHAVADVCLAHSLIRSLPQVDGERTGVTGISWGGYLTCLMVGVDERFKFAAPVYGCGFIDECVWAPTLEKMAAEKRTHWLDQWDPRHYLKGAKTPMLWVTGTNDFAYPFGALQKSYRLPAGPRTLCITLKMPHGHPPGQTPEVIRAYADVYLKSGQRLPEITGQGRDQKTGVAWATFASPTAVGKAELLYTSDVGPWQKRTWQVTPATIGDDYKVTAKVPAGTAAYFLNLTDERGLTVSAEHEELKRE
jgi:dienelactone hydrolase